MTDAPILEVQRLNLLAKCPSKATAGAANYDLFACETVVIGPGKTDLVGTGLRMRVPSGYVLEVYGRSGLARDGLIVANGPGQVDADYRGEVKVILYNSDRFHAFINEGDRVAQCRLVPVQEMYVEEVADISINETERGEGGFGSTGT